MTKSGRRARWPAATGVVVLAMSALGTLPGFAETAGEETPVVSFWVVLKHRADLSAAAAGEDRAAFVYRTLTADAAESQAGLRRLLTDRKATFEPYWIANTIHVTGDAALRAELAGRPEVERIDPDTKTSDAQAPAGAGGEVPPPVDGVEWNIHRIGADQAWKKYGTRGEGIVVATIDTGVDGDHAALAANYRGRFSTGSADDDYNWYDAFGSCPGPCDFDGHGTHVTGLAAGRAAGGGNQIGVAPGARWIAANGCCEQEGRLAAGQWMLAPTDRNGQNPRPDLAPDIVNNSWFFRDDHGSVFGDILDAWVAAGIFPVFAAGNEADNGSCASNTWPASFASSYTVGNSTPENTIAESSSRGPTEDGRNKPDIAAPGTSIRSSDIGPELLARDGTSQAAPQVAGAVALLWSAVPKLEGDVAATRKLLSDTAREIDETACGGTADLNNAAGAGLLDIPAALRAAPRDPVGALAGTVRRADTGATLPDATIELTGPRAKSLLSDGRGRFGLPRLLPGSYTYRASAFGFQDRTGTLTVTAGRSAAPRITLTPQRIRTVTGVVRSPEGPLAGATVSVGETPARVRTGKDGRYRLALPDGGHELSVEPPTRCQDPVRQRIEVTAGTTLDIDLPARTDEGGYGHTCTEPVTGYRQGDTKLALTGSVGAVVEVPLPFPVGLYGKSFRTAWVGANGVVSFAGAPEPPFSDQLFELPDSSEPTSAVFPFYTLLDVDSKAGVYLSRSADQVVVEWREVAAMQPLSRVREGRLSISLVIRPDGTFTVNYRDVDPGYFLAGRNALIGLQNDDGSDAFVYGSLDKVVTSGLGFTIHPPR